MYPASENLRKSIYLLLGWCSPNVNVLLGNHPQDGEPATKAVATTKSSEANTR